MTEQRLDPRLTLAILDAIFYCQVAIDSGRREIDINNMVRDMFKTAKRDKEVEEKPALPINALMAIAFVDALADYGYTIVPSTMLSPVPNIDFNEDN